MEYRPLGRTDLRVSVICLGTMTYGEQNTEAEGHQQMDYALERGVNFFDTAEMYSVPPRAETYGRTEEVIGTWFKASGKRDKVILATKVVGPGERFAHVRDGKPKFDRKHITQAVEDSLRRLQTDYIDLYQLHWPERSVNTFGKLGYTHVEDEVWTPLEESLGVLADLVKEGKIRHIGLSNETPWGAMKCIALAETMGLPRVASIQNPYNLLNRSFEVGLAEVAIRENCGLLAYSPIAGGVLSGKYLDGAQPKGARMTMFPGNFSRYSTPNAEPATIAYVELAKEFGFAPADLANAFVNTRQFTTSNIIGATTMEQLKSNIDTWDMALPDDVLEEIERIHHLYCMPCP
ncbi:MAG: NADP(H)-dependent aldo-keto reductase [Nisaea sp.]|uniref:NADP(H)-dependent aldo-keto reductase n=1 Tax=Nisaea sp. TaxID=2024842 RepID=UPI001B1E08B7|nr:NADP(H)-dependent aldo-keto reductase [Nisaea sp.]MBO6561762.1 NADP(H)-dependent aldo-keto reductase [Nisaea sp.]